jgi:hypothetical protein
MTISKLTKFGIVGIATGMIAGLAGADTNSDLQERLAQAEARIAELSANTNSNWLNDQRSEEVRELVQDVLADADSRAMLQGRNHSPVTVNLHGFMQFRWTYNHNATDGVDNTHGFSVPRTRLIVSGDIYDWDYTVSGQWNDGNAFNLTDAYAEKAGFKFGQFKSPFLKETLVSQTDTLASERTVVSNQFGQGRSQGIQYGFDLANGLGAKVAYTDGFNTANGAGVVNGYALTGRLDYDGEWFDAGFAVSHNSLDVVDYNTWTIDASTRWNALEFGGAYVKQTGDATGENWGTTVYVKYDMRYGLDIFAQYERGHLEGVATDLSIATFGFNYLINDNMKWTSDIGYSYNGIDGAWNLGQSGWNASGTDGEYLIRSQIQVTF